MTIEDAFGNTNKNNFGVGINDKDIERTLGYNFMEVRRSKVNHDEFNEKIKNEVENHTGYSKDRGFIDFFKTVGTKGVIDFEESKLSESERFDYDKALKDNVNPSQIIDFLSSKDTKFDYSQARKDLGDEKLVDLLKDRGEKNLLNEKKSKVGAYSDFQAGMIKASLGINALISDGLHKIGVISDEAHSSDITNIQRTTKAIDETRMDKDIISSYTAGDIAGQILSSPAATSRVAIGTIGGLLGYANERGNGGSESESLIAGGVSSAIGLGINEAFIQLSKPASKKVFEYYENEIGLTRSESDHIYDNWLKLNESTGSEFADRTKAIIDHSGTYGARMKEDIIINDIKLGNNIVKNKADRIRTMNSMLANDFDPTKFSKNLNKISDTIKSNYNLVKGKIDTDKGMVSIDTTYFKLGKELNDVSTDRAALAELLGKNKKGMKNKKNHITTVSDLMDGMPHLNAMINRAKGKQLRQLTELKNNMKLSIEDAIDDDVLYKAWNIANEDYAVMNSVLKSKIGDALSRITKSGPGAKQINANRAMEIIKTNKNSGDKTFRDIAHIVGKSETEHLELGIIDNAFNNHIDDFSWRTLEKSINTKGFISESANNLSELIKLSRDTFRTDDALRQIIRKDSQNINNNMSSTIGGKVMIMLNTSILKRMIKRIPFSRTAKDLRMKDELSEILASPEKLRMIKASFEDLDEGIKNDILERAINEVIE